MAGSTALGDLRTVLSPRSEAHWVRAVSGPWWDSSEVWGDPGEGWGSEEE